MFVSWKPRKPETDRNRPIGFDQKKTKEKIKTTKCFSSSVHNKHCKSAFVATLMLLCLNCARLYCLAQQPQKRPCRRMMPSPADGSLRNIDYLAGFADKLTEKPTGKCSTRFVSLRFSVSFCCVFDFVFVYKSTETVRHFRLKKKNDRPTDRPIFVSGSPHWAPYAEFVVRVDVLWSIARKRCTAVVFRADFFFFFFWLSTMFYSSAATTPI